MEKHNEAPIPATGVAVTGDAGFSPFDPILSSPTGGENVPGKAVLPGFGGLPFHGEIPLLKETDPDRLKPQEANKIHVDILELSNVEHLTRYRSVMQAIINGFASLSEEIKEYDKELKNWRVFLRWVERFSYMKGDKNG